MNKKFFISWLIVFIVWMAGSFLVHGVLLGKEYASLPLMFRAEADSANYFHFMLLAHVSLSAALIWVYDRGRENKEWLTQGLRFGVSIAFLTAIPTYMIYYAVQPMPGAMVIKQVAFDGGLLLVLGALIAFLYRDEPTR